MIETVETTSGIAVKLEAVWPRVAAYAFDEEGDRRRFVDRLCEETGWQPAFAEAAIFEYRRFVSLAMAVDHRVSPSHAVDEVWHQHVMDTRRYWQDFCPNVLGRDFHHEPGRGGAAEEIALRQAYRATLSSYERLFGEAPPAAFWPRPGAPPRQGAGARIRQALRGLARRAWHFSLIPVVLGLAGCASLIDSSSPGAVQGGSFLMLFLLMLALVIPAGLGLQKLVLSSAGGKVSGHERLDAYQIAYLTGGKQRVLQTALLRLYATGAIAFHLDKVVAAGALPAGAEAIERRLHGQLGKSPRKVAPGLVDSDAAAIRQALRRFGLVPDEEAGLWGFAALALVLAPVFVIGLLRISHGTANGRPVGFLIALLIFGGLAAAALGVRNGRRTSAGDGVLRQARMALPRTELPETGDPSLARAVALYGGGAIAGLGLTGFDDFMRRAQASSGGSGSDSSSSCGSSSCGGGGCGG